MSAAPAAAAAAAAGGTDPRGGAAGVSVGDVSHPVSRVTVSAACQSRPSVGVVRRRHGHRAAREHTISGRPAAKVLTSDP